MPQRLIVALLAVGLFLAGCGGGSSTSTPGAAVSSLAGAASSAASSVGAAASSAASSAASAASSAASPDASSTATGTATGASACPTENTRNFAKTRFVADIGGSLFLFNRYLYQPYQRGDFQQGAQGRRTALIKAGLAAAAIAKLMDNARENAKANPTLCRSVAEPLGQAIDQVKGLATGLATGNFGAIDSVRGLLGRVQSGSNSSGVGNIPETNPNIPGLN